MESYDEGLMERGKRKWQEGKEEVNKEEEYGVK